MTEPSVLKRARELVPSLRAQNDAIEQDARLPAEVAIELAEAGLFRLLIPSALGGEEVEPATFVATLATLAEGDAAAAWCVMTGSTTSLLSAYLSEEAAGELFRPKASIFSGVFAPMGRATPTEGGYRLQGRWPFASGCDNATWCMGGALVIEDGTPRLHEGTPEVRSLFFPMKDARIDPTWDTLGLRGTGSHDVEVQDLFVPEAHTCCVFQDRPQEGPLYRFPIFGLLAAGVAAVGLGIGRAALRDAEALAKDKKSPVTGRTLAEQSHFQLELARAEGELEAGRALLLARCREGWETAQRQPLDPGARAALRLAAAQAVRASVRATDAMYQAGGGAALYRRNPLQRHLRDIHTVTQHVMVGTGPELNAAKVLLGLRADLAQL